jgi:hypothetical protein
MNRMRGLWIAALVVVTGGPACAGAASAIGFHGYLAVADGLSSDAQVFGQRVVHQTYDLQLSESVRKIPVLALQYAGPEHAGGPANDPKHVEARAKCVAERLIHAWTLMDHGAKLEIGDDDWNAYQVPPQPNAPKHLGVFIRSPVAGDEPLRIVTIYPEDVAAYPWISSERSLAEYWMTMIQAHYLLFWKNDSTIGRYRELPLERTQEGQIFKEIATRAAEATRARGQERFDGSTVKAVLAGMSLTERETLYRLATVPPMDWEPSSR